MESITKTIATLATLILILPMSMSYAASSKDNNKLPIFDNNTDHLTLEDAEIMVLMNTSGKILDAKTIENPNGDETFLIKVDDGLFNKLYMVDQNAKIELVEVNTLKVV